MMKKIIMVTLMSLAAMAIMVFPCFAADVIYGCYHKNNGQLRIAKAASECRHPEIFIQWNKVGPAGPAGAAGPAGPAGPQGPAGANVAAGQQCPQGSFVVGFDQQGNIICAQLTYAIGDTGPAGGIVFYIYANGLHGLEAAPADQGSGAEWGCFETSIAGADGTAVGTGAQNTADILAGCSTPGIAARIADAYTLNGYTDWFLPSKDELNLLYQQKVVVGGFAIDGYWSSSEASSYVAWYQNFTSGLQVGNGGKYHTLRVRAVRAF